MSPQSRRRGVGSSSARERKLPTEEVCRSILSGEPLPSLERLDRYEAIQGARRAKTSLQEAAKLATGSARTELLQRLARVQAILQMFERFRW